MESIIQDIRDGKMVIMADDESRENEGDLVFAASKVTPEKVNMMMRFARGLICAPLAEERMEVLGLKDMAISARDPMGTAFTVSVDARRGITTGISAFDRAKTIEILADPNYGPEDLVSPGHMFPLRAKRGGVLVRAGHTEAAVDLARLAGLKPAGVICEIVNDDGTMARLPDLEKFSRQHGIKIGTIRDLIEYRLRFDKLVERVSEFEIHAMMAGWKLMVYRSLVSGVEHLAFVKGPIGAEPTLVRVHAEVAAEGNDKAAPPDNLLQLFKIIEIMDAETSGVVLYLRKDDAESQHTAAVLRSHFSAHFPGQPNVKFNLREYGTGAQILKDLGLSKLRLITTSPKKIIGIEGYGLRVVENILMKNLVPDQFQNNESKWGQLARLLHT